MTAQAHITHDNGAIVEVPLNKLKASPRNARRTPHAAADIETLAASIASKGMIQLPVVEPELDSEGHPTGFYLVTVGEGRRQAMLLRVKRKQIGKAHPIRCIVDGAHDAHEISLDENVTRFAMHPADQFQAFQRLAEDRGFGPEEIAARFGVTPVVVRQRLKLAAVSPKLMTIYREGAMSLDQLMAFTLTGDHSRQEGVWEGLSWNKEPSLIRRMLTQDRARGTDRRAIFVGPDAYLEAGGVIERDLFSEDYGGYYADPSLLDRLTQEKLEQIAQAVQADGWKWAQPSLELPPTHGLRRIYPRACDLATDDEQRLSALSDEYDELFAAHEADDELDEEVATKLRDLGAEIEALDAKRQAYDPEDLARAGAFVVLGPDGAPRIDRGFIRPEDEPKAAPQDGDDPGGELTPEEEETPEVEDDRGGPSPLSERLIADLTAHRTAAIRDCMAANANIALAALVHALALQVFTIGHDFPSCLELRLESVNLVSYAAALPEARAGQSIEARHATWATELPTTSEALWHAILDMPVDRRLMLLAHCVSLSVNAVKTAAGRSRSASHGDAVARGLALDMADYWSPTVGSYLGRVSKAHILAAVSEGVSADASQRIDGLKKQPMAEAAEGLLNGSRWLPAVLRADPLAGSEDHTAA